MNSWMRDYDKLKYALGKMGWKAIKNEVSGLESWYSQGVLYSNFTKEGRAIHIEYGDESDIFSEEVDC